MRLRRTALAFSVVIAILLLNCCGGNGPTFIPTPVISSLSPDGVIAGSASFTLTIAGTGFQSNSQVFWNGSCVTTAPPSTTCATVTYNASTTQLSVPIPAAYITKVGFPQITVVNPFPGGPSLLAFTFTISASNNPIPTITSLAPSNTPVGVLPPGGTVTVNGTNFIQTSTVSFNGNPRATQFVSATQLVATVTQADVNTGGSINVQVSNPQPGGGVSTGSTFTVGPPPAAIVHSAINSGAQMSPELISVSAAEGAANGASSSPAMSADARFVVFYSAATNLVASGASGSVFVRDTCLGMQNCTPQTMAVDLDINGNAPSAAAGAQVAISANGRFVAFSSTAANLVVAPESAAQNAVPTSEPRVYVRDLCEGADVPAGCTPHTELASIDATGSSVSGSFPAVNGDGRFVAFVSAPASLAADGTTPATRIYVRDTCAGPTANSACAPKTIPVAANVSSPKSVDPLGISIDGRYVAFAATAGSMVSYGSQQGISAVRLADTCEGISAPAACTLQTANISIAPSGLLLTGSNGLPSMSGDGRFIVFQSGIAATASNSTNNAPQIFSRDTCNGPTAPNGCTPSTTLIADDATAPSIDPSGRYITYVLAKTSTSSPSADATSPLYVYDTCFGATASCSPNAYPTIAGSIDSSTTAPAGTSVVAVVSKAALGLLPSTGLGDVYLIPIPH